MTDGENRKGHCTKERREGGTALFSEVGSPLHANTQRDVVLVASRITQTDCVLEGAGGRKLFAFARILNIELGANRGYSQRLRPPSIFV